MTSRESVLLYCCRDVGHSGKHRLLRLDVQEESGRLLVGLPADTFVQYCHGIRKLNLL